MTTPGVEWWSGRDRGWRYLAFRVDGLGGPRTLLEAELPLDEVQMTDVLSGPPQMTGTIAPHLARLVAADGLPLLRPWRTAIFAEQDGVLNAGGLLVASGYSGPEWHLDVSGFSGYLHGQPYEGDESFVDADPTDIFRHVWAHVQNQPGRNMGITVGSTTSPVKVGRPLPGKPSTVTPAAGSGDEGPYRLTWWQNHDLMETADGLAEATPFDYHERWQWNADKTFPVGFIDLGYPRLGRRQIGPRYILGENIHVIPDVEEDGEDFANDVRVLGAGEGSAMVVGRATAATDGLRRTRTIERKDLTDKGRADRAAQQELLRSLLTTSTPTVAVTDTPQAPLSATQVGDEIRLQVDAADVGGWRDIDLWFRVTSKTIDPDAPSMGAFSLLRSELVQ